MRSLFSCVCDYFLMVGRVNIGLHNTCRFSKVGSLGVPIQDNHIWVLHGDKYVSWDGFTIDFVVGYVCIISQLFNKLLFMVFVV